MLTVVFLLTMLAAPNADAKQRVRIVGGGATPIANVPWQIGLLFAGTEDTYDAQFCGGTIRDPSHVITAAHCVDGYPASSFDILAGTSTLGNGSGQRIHVAQVDVNPGYDDSTQSNDAALLTLTSPITVPTAAALPPITAGQAAAIDSPSDDLLVSGWGSTVGYEPSNPSPSPSYPTDLRSVTVPFVTDPTCAASYGSALVPTTMLCAGAGGKDSCQGDSGGPLAFNNGGAWALAGIVSWGAGCGSAGYPGVYTEVASQSVRDFVTSTPAIRPTDEAEPDDLSDYESDAPDSQKPVITLRRKQCVRRTCNVLFAIDDGTDGSGVSRVRAVLRSKLKPCSARARAARSCSRTRKLRVLSVADDGVYSVTATKLRRGHNTITITAVDNQDNAAHVRVAIRSR